MTRLDIIILSNAKTESLKRTTENCIKSLIESKYLVDVHFDVLVLESNQNLKPYSFPNSKTVYPDMPFGYNRFVNIALRQTKNDYVCICNNDLIFHKGWAEAILTEMEKDTSLQSANPYCTRFNYNATILSGPPVMFRHKNPGINGVLTGWCIFFKRSILEKTGYFDEQFEFWYADNDYDMTLRKHGIRHALIKNSKVDHLGMLSHSTLEDLKGSTTDQRLKFEKKWYKNRWQVLRYKIRDLLHV